MNKIRVFLIDDQPIFRSGLTLLLNEQPDMGIVGALVQDTDIIETIQGAHPDVVLMDIDMSGVQAFDTIHRITESNSDLAVLILTIHDQEEFLFQALQAGALGYLLKDSSVEELLAAIRTINSGDAFICPIMTTKLVGDYVKRTDSSYSEDAYNRLSMREREVLPLLAEGRTNEDIASMLSVSPYTIQTYRQRVMKKLDLHNRTDLLKYALRRGLITLEE